MPARKRTEFAAAIAIACAAGSAQAADLSGFVTDLYGGDGITLTSSPNAGPIAPLHAAHFTADSLERFESLNSSIGSSVGSFAFTSTFTGVTYDVATGIPVEARDSLGPLLTESAATLGAGKFNFSFGASRLKYNSIDGEKLSNLVLEFRHEDCCSFQNGVQRPPADGVISGFEADLLRVDLDIKLQYYVYAFAGSFGITDRWDAGVVVPVISVDARADAVATIENLSGVPNVHTFLGQQNLSTSSTGGSKTGIGDVAVRTKVNLVRDALGTPDIALIAQVTLPTGDEDNLLGIGHTRYKVGLIASRRYGAFGPHLNVAYEEVSGGGDALDNYSYAAGIDARVTPKFTAGVDLIGRRNPDQRQLDRSTMDAALSAKWNPFSRLNLPFNAYVLAPINKDHGLRPKVSYGVGFDLVL